MCVNVWIFHIIVDDYHLRIIIYLHWIDFSFVFWCFVLWMSFLLNNLSFLPWNFTIAFIPIQSLIIVFSSSSAPPGNILNCPVFCMLIIAANLQGPKMCLDQWMVCYFGDYLAFFMLWCMFYWNGVGINRLSNNQASVGSGQLNQKNLSNS